MSGSLEDLPMMERSQQEGEKLESEIAVKLDLTVIRYSRVWEDCDILCRGLDIQPNDVVLSITRYINNNKVHK